MKIKNSKSVLIGLITLIIAFIAWFFGLKQLLNNIEIITYDWRAKIATDTGPFNSKFSKASKDIILLSADDYSFQKLGQHPELGVGRWPWPRKTLGEVVNFISSANPKAIVFDIKFEGAEGTNIESINSDDYLSAALKKTDNTVLALALSYSRARISTQIDGILAQQDFKSDDLDRFICDMLNLNTEPVKNRLTVKINDAQLSAISSRNQYVKELFNNITFFGYSSIFDKFLESTNYAGVINLKSGEDMIARYNVPLYRLANAKRIGYLPSLPLAAVLSVLPENEKTPLKLEKNKITIGKRIIPINSKGEILINWHGSGGTYKAISIAKVILTSAYQQGELKKLDDRDKVSSEEFKDKIIVIGQTSAGTDIHPTPMGMAYPGPEIIATAIDNYLNDADTKNSKARKFITKPPIWLDLGILVIFCLATGIFNIRARNVLLSISWFLLMEVLFILMSAFVFLHPGIRVWINMTYPIIFITLTAIGTYIYKIYKEEKEKKVVQGLFGKFVSPQVLDKLLQDPKSISRDGQRKIMSVLFSDIRGFTTLSESTPAQELIPQLNEYLTEMVEVVLKYNGTFDKYIGDAVMAFFGDPLPMEDHALRAVLTAVDMKSTLDILNKKWVKEGKHVLNIGIGVNTGEMIVGHIGSHRLLDYTVIGDNVNLASRLEGLNKEYKTNIIISESTYNSVKEFVEAEYLDEVKVKGKQNAVKVYAVYGIKAEANLPLLVSAKSNS